MIVGITGSIASGKSLVTNYLLERGYQIIDSDVIAREKLQKPEVIAILEAHFGKRILVDRQINRQVLGDIIFNNEQERLYLNSIIHPLVIDEIKNITKNHQELIFVDVPLLYEANIENMFHKVIVVYVNPEKQLKRLMKRDNIDEDKARLKIQSQWALDLKKAKADFVIDNSGRITHTQFQVEQILRRLKNEN
ncbi:MAG: dephospho-CoA kinase [Bacilli bacterium]